MKAVSLKNLSYRYPDGKVALCEVSFSIAEGERVALIGPNGAGKSTLLLHLNGLLPEHALKTAAVHILETPLIEEHALAIRSQVGLLFQDPDDQLFCSTIGEDVAFGPQQMGLSAQEIAARVTKALAQVGLSGFERRVPNHLSHGEKRRACIAGLLACNCRILVLDEPTSGLDPRGKRELKSLLKNLPQTQLIATHDLELVAELCSRVLLIDAGILYADGVTKEILADEALMLAHGLEKPHCLQHLHPH